MTLEVLLQWTNHLAKESMKRPRLYIADPASLSIDRHHAPDDASSRPPEGAREVFSQKMICDVGRPSRGERRAAQLSSMLVLLDRRSKAPALWCRFGRETASGRAN